MTAQHDLEIAECTNPGSARTHNEDYVQHTIPTERRMASRKGILCLVADGMGGHSAGEVASRAAVELVVRHYYSEPVRDAAGALARAFRAANSAIAEQSDSARSRAGMGTTLVCVAVCGRHVVVANVGDSRAYHVGTRGIRQITADHSWVVEQVQAGLLSSEQARMHPQRNLVTRALGTRPDVEVDLFEGTMGGGDWLVLCTDGLTNCIGDAEIESAVRAHPPSEAAHALIDLVDERGGRDDATVLVVHAKRTSSAAGLVRNGERRRHLRARLLLHAAAILSMLGLLLSRLPGA